MRTKPMEMSFPMPRRRPNRAQPSRYVGTHGSARCRGFTLLELLMAITALIIIVLGLSLVFQQTQTVWGSSIRQASAETTLRSVLGMLNRDLTHAVDATAFGQISFFPDLSDPNRYIFYTLDGTNRVPQKVVYTYGDQNLKRDFYSVSSVSSPTNWSFSTTAESTTDLNGSQPLTQFKVTTVWAPSSAFSQDLPLYVTIEVHTPKGGTFGVVSGWSEGRNRPGHPEDRIVANP